VREGSALLQGLAVCGQCGRKLRTHYTGRTASAGYHCAGKTIANGRGVYCLSIGAMQIDEAVARAVLAALTPQGVKAALAAAQRLEAITMAPLMQHRLAVERASYETQRAERRYRAVDPDNRLVARGLEAEWERCLRELNKRQVGNSRRREQLRPKTLDTRTSAAVCSQLGSDSSRPGRRRRPRYAPLLGGDAAGRDQLGARRRANAGVRCGTAFVLVDRRDDLFDQLSGSSSFFRAPRSPGACQAFEEVEPSASRRQRSSCVSVLGRSCFAAREFRLGVVEFAQTSLPLGFEAAGHEAVVRVHGTIAAFRPLRLVAGALHSETMLHQCAIVIGFQPLRCASAALTP